MSDLEYVQGKGFLLYEFPASIAWADDEDLSDFAKRLGLSDGFKSENGTGSCDVTVYAAGPKSPCRGHGVFGLVVMNVLSESCDLVVARSEADWLALRLHIANQTMLSSVHDWIAEIRAVSDRAFRHAHKHDPGRACGQCMSDVEVAERDRIQHLHEQRRWPA